MGAVAATAAALLLAALVLAVEGSNSCFEDYAISRLYKAKYDVCSESNTAICKYISLSIRCEYVKALHAASSLSPPLACLHINDKSNRFSRSIQICLS